jgi:hypothetical protein
MAGKMKAVVDVQVQDNGTVVYTFSAIDTLGQPTAMPTGTPALSNIVVTDPGAVGGAANLVVTPNPGDTTGFVLLGTPTLQPGVVLPDTGIIVSAQTTFPGATSPVTGTASPIDIVAGAAAGLGVAELSNP